LNQLIDEGLISALCEQIGHEKYNANLYLYIAAYLKNKGLENLSALFESQHDEETGHSKMIYELLTDLSADVFIPEISEVAIPFNSILDVAKAYLDREIQTTQSLDDIKKLAIDQNNPVVEEAMRDMIKLQRNEYAEATDFMDKAEITKGDWNWVLNWDLGLK
jgi:ferritin